MYRYFGGDVTPMELVVDRVTDKEIHSGAWDFDKVTGEELDDFVFEGGSEGEKVCLSYIRAEKR